MQRKYEIEKKFAIDARKKLEEIVKKQYERKISENEIKEWLEKFSLDPSDKKSIKKYSLGMKQKVSIIQAFMNNPDLLLLDEPKNALDSDTINCLVELIHNVNRDRGATLIIASHDRANLDGLCDKIIEMREGKIV